MSDVKSIINNYLNNKNYLFEIPNYKKENAITILKDKIEKAEKSLEVLEILKEGVKEYGNKVYNKRFYDFLSNKITQETGKKAHVYQPQKRFESEMKKMNICVWNTSKNRNDTILELITEEGCKNKKVDVKQFQEILTREENYYKQNLKECKWQLENIDELVKAVDEVINLYNSTMNFIDYEVLKSWEIKSRA